MGKIIDFVKHLFHRKKQPNPITEYNKAKEELGVATQKIVEKAIDVGIDALANRNKEPTYQPLFVPKPGSQAVHQNVGKFMKHGRQAPYYRKSVKAKVQPEEDN